ncbi:hypothetical protein [Nocardia asiatica]|uniref:hypothetical protein n=1 Tax=Nocardia asiatica TaxID=209252 RepID=UPI000318A060|nr:hypothetical protein [Nocardia asiatica]
MNRDDDPIVSRLEPLPDDGQWGTSYEAASDDVLATLAKVSAALSGAGVERAQTLRMYQRQLAACQHDLSPADPSGITAAHRMCDEIRADLESEA